MSQNGTTPNVRLHVLIVGAGIAGLSAARALRLCGHSVEIFERSKFSNEVGAAVTISPNGTRVLRALGFDFKGVGGVDVRWIRTFDARTLAMQANIDTGDADSIYGAPHQAMHRQDLHSELLRLACLDEVNTGPLVGRHMGVKITKIDVKEARIELEDGRAFKGDLLVGADGLRSDVRAAALGMRQEPLDTEWQIYRFLLPREKVMNDEVMRKMKGENARMIYDSPDPKTESRTRFVWYECRNGEVQNFAGFYRGDEDETKVEDFGNLAEKSTVLRLFKPYYHPKIMHIIEQAEDILYWRVYERDPLPTFVYHHTILIGDAGHAMMPFTAAGATQALEDAGALLGLFKDIRSETRDEKEGEGEGKGEREIERRLRLFDRVRCVRGTRIQTGSALPYKDGRKNPLTDENLRIELLDEDLPSDLRELGLDNPKRLAFDFKYDVFKKCREVLAEGAA